MDIPLILVTNDDGIESDGLWAVAEALLPIGELLVVAPDRQWSGGGRSMPSMVTGEIRAYVREIEGQRVLGYAVDASPALAVQHGVLELAPRMPSLVVSGVNYGYNLGNEVTISGTVGAALEGAAFGIPSIAVSLEMDPHYHLLGDARANYAAAKSLVQHFALHLLSYPLPYDVDVLNINLPVDATPDTPWRLTRLAHRRYFYPQAPNRAGGEGRPGYRLLADPMQTRTDSDIWGVQVDRVVSVTPLSLDLTARTDLRRMGDEIRAGIAEGRDRLEALSTILADPMTTTARVN
ncbi:MAG: 5'/3'-nucleotidase SurE [Anaerolineae bacterium]|nr:5'/3'-nucleotidase SurE [Anaerolineae bacterium]